MLALRSRCLLLHGLRVFVAGVAWQDEFPVVMRMSEPWSFQYECVGPVPFARPPWCASSTRAEDESVG